MDETFVPLPKHNYNSSIHYSDRESSSFLFDLVQRSDILLALNKDGLYVVKDRYTAVSGKYLTLRERLEILITLMRPFVGIKVFDDVIHNEILNKVYMILQKHSVGENKDVINRRMKVSKDFQIASIRNAARIYLENAYSGE